MSSLPLRALIVSSSVLFACSSDAGSSQSAHVRDAEVPEPSAAAELPPCMWTLDACPEHIDWRLDTLLRASELDADARFIAIGGQVVGVAAGTSKSVVRVHMEDDMRRNGDKFRRYTLPETVVNLIDVVDGIAGSSEVSTVYALACQQPEAACSLWRVSADAPDGSALEEIADSTFEGDATALLFDEDQQQPCVLAKGLHCFDGAWHEDIAPITEDNDVRDVAMGGTTSIAVAARGVYWTRRRVPPGRPAMPWTQESAGADVAWTGASDIYSGYFLIGEQGAFMQNLSNATTLCSHTSDFAASSGSILVTKQGDVLFGFNEGRCVLQSLDTDAIIGHSTVHCRASKNSLVMTEHSIAGTTFCVRF